MSMRIDDICTYAPKSGVKAGEATKDGQYMFFTSSEDESKRYTDYQYDGEGIIMGTGGNATLHYYHGKYAVSTDCIVLNPDDRLRCKYLYYFFLANMPILEAGFKGAGLKHTNKKYIGSITIPEIPPFDEQDRIIEVLDKISGIINTRNLEIAALDDMIKARFVEMFGDPVANTFEWKTAFLREVTSKIGSGATPRGGKESYQAEGISLIRSMNVHDGRFEYKDLAHITDEQASQLDNVTVEEGDVFINITGASVARSCIVPKDILPARVNQHVAIIRCIRDFLNPTFANNMFLNDRFKGQLLDIGESGGATRQAITKQQLENLTVVLPPIELQAQFAAFAKQVDKSKVAVQKALDQAQLLFDSLMQKYFGWF